MSRRKADPVQSAFDAFVSLTPEQAKEFHAMVYGHNRAKGAVAAEPAKRTRGPNKPKADHPHNIAAVPKEVIPA